MDSILGTIKKAIGVDADFHVYDPQIITNINLVLAKLNEIGVGPVEVFSITSDAQTWTNFLGDTYPFPLDKLQTYICEQVRAKFDPLAIDQLPISTDSILGTIKKMLGITNSDTSFDTDIIVNINSALMALNQLSVGPTDPFVIISNAETWTQFLEANSTLEAVKSYIYLKVKLAFDPPASSTIVEAYKSQIAEYEFRLNIQAEKGTYLIMPPLVIIEDEQ